MESAAGPSQRIALCREAGGLGDILNVATVAGLLERQGHKVDVWTLPQYVEVWKHLRGAGRFRPWCVPLGQRRGRLMALPRCLEARADQKLNAIGGHYLDDLASELKSYDRVVDLFCPGYCYEMSEEIPTKGRLTCFAEAAGVEIPAESPFPRWDHLDSPDAMLGGSVIGLALTATDPARSYPFALARQLIFQLMALDFPVVVFDLDRRITIPGFALPHKGGLYHEMVGKPIGHVARALEEVALLVTVESGLSHLAAMLETPTLVLCGPTDPIAQLRHYPNSEPITAYRWGDKSLAGELSPCHSPCWFRKARGWDEIACRNDGCFWMHSIEPSAIVARVQAMIGSMK